MRLTTLNIPGRRPGMRGAVLSCAEGLVLADKLFKAAGPDKPIQLKSEMDGLVQRLVLEEQAAQREPEVVSYESSGPELG